MCSSSSRYFFPSSRCNLKLFHLKAILLLISDKMQFYMYFVPIIEPYSRYYVLNFFSLSLVLVFVSSTVTSCIAFIITFQKFIFNIKRSSKLPFTNRSGVIEFAFVGYLVVKANNKRYVYSNKSPQLCLHCTVLVFYCQK